MLNKILSGIVGVLILVVGWMGYSKSKVEHRYNEAITRISNLESNNKKLENTINAMTELRKKEDVIVKDNQEKYNSLDEVYTDTIKNITEKGNTNADKEDGGGINRNSLDSAISGMLNDLCERVRGSPCPDS